MFGYSSDGFSSDGYYSDGYYSDDCSNGEPFLFLKEEVRRGDIAAIRRALANHNANPNGTDSDKGDYTLLHWAAGMTYSDAAEEVRASPSTPIHVRREIVRLLIQHGAKAWPIWWQLDFCHTEGQRTWDLTDDAETERILWEACINQFLEDTQGGDAGDRSERKQAAFYAAAALNRTDALREIFAEGDVKVDDDSCDCTALSVASTNGCLEAVRFLVQTCGASVNHNYRDMSGRTALWDAADCGHVDTVECLIRLGADVFTSSNGLLVMFVDSNEVRSRLLKAAHASIPRDATMCADWPQDAAFVMFTAFGCVEEGLIAMFNAGCTAPPDILQTAIAFGQLESLECLIAYGALLTYDESREARFYGTSTMRPTEDAVKECQERLEEAIAARHEFQQLQAENN